MTMLLLRQQASARAQRATRATSLASRNDSATNANADAKTRGRRTKTPNPLQNRSPKDPSSFASYDAIRAHLQRGDAGGGFIAGLLNSLSDRVFGYGGGGAFADFYCALLRFWPSGGGAATAPPSSDLLDTSTATPTAQSDALAALLSLSRGRAAALARRHPALNSLQPEELGRRVLALKRELPGCDVAALVEARPDLYLGLGGGGAAAADKEEEEAAAANNNNNNVNHNNTTVAAASRAGKALASLRENLVGADVNEIAFEDPALLFYPHDKLERGLRRLKALWPTADEQALAASEPRHLALAVRALGEGEGDDDGDGDDDIEEARRREDDGR